MFGCNGQQALMNQKATVAILELLGDILRTAMWRGIRADGNGEWARWQEQGARLTDTFDSG